MAVAIADVILDENYRTPRLLGTAPLDLGFVALPSLLPIVAARTTVLRILVVAAMSAVAVFAGVELVASDDAQAGLAVLLVAFVAIPLAFVIWIGESIAGMRRAAAAPEDQDAPPVVAQPSERLAALGIDAALIIGVLVVPLTALSKSGPDIADYAAGVIAVFVGTLYLGALVALRGGSVGHAIMCLTVIDPRTLGRVGFTRALARSFIVVLEVIATPTIILAIPAVVELASVADHGASVTDRVLKTSVVRTWTSSSERHS